MLVKWWTVSCYLGTGSFPDKFTWETLDRTDFLIFISWQNEVGVDLELYILSIVGKCEVGKRKITLQFDQTINIQIQLTEYLLT